MSCESVNGGQIIRLTSRDLKVVLPDTVGNQRLAGLEGLVKIYRDGYGIPHVMANSSADAFFGQGFATAQDRLWHMDCDRRRAYGRWAEFAGGSVLDQDKTMRRFQIAPTVKNDYRAVNSETRAMLDAYAAGVNAFIQTTRAFPIEYSLVDGEPESWDPWDCLAVFKVRFILMGVFESKLWRAHLVNKLGPEAAAELIRGYQHGHLLIIPPGLSYEGSALDGSRELSRGTHAINWLRETDIGSNNWVISGTRTASGKPLMAGDPHRGLDTPNVYYQNQLACPEFDVIGLSFPGCPGFPNFGHNSNVCWSVTHAGSDYQDLYVERFAQDRPTQYELNGRYVEAELRHELIKVKGGKSTEINVAITRHGPIVARDPNSHYGLSFKYTSTTRPNLGFQAIRRMLEASSVAEMDESMRPWVDPCNNLLFADIHGSIGYLNRGEVPIRSMANAWLPVPGWNSEYEWDGQIPFEDLPRSRNPENGYIVTANNRIVGQDYPYYIALDFAPEYRARRITERLKSLERATAEDMVAVHADRVSIPALTYLNLLRTVDVSDAFTKAAKKRFDGWDGSMEQDWVAPTIYSAFRERLHGLIVRWLLGDALGSECFRDVGRGAAGHLRQLASLIVTMVAENNISLLPSGENWKSIASQALSEGISDLRERLGEDLDSWHWGKVHYTRPRHPLSTVFPELASALDPPSVPMGGDGDTVQAGPYTPDEPFVMTGMSVARYVFDLSDWGKSAWITPLGSSGHPGSNHYADQAPIWSRVSLVPMVYDWKRIAEDAESHQSLVPR